MSAAATTQPSSSVSVAIQSADGLRLEDAALLTGRGEFADDLPTKPGTLHAAILRSQHAHARIRSVDTSAVLGMPGLRAVLTAADVRRWARPLGAALKLPVQQSVLAEQSVHYQGEPIAVVVAESRYLAEDALDGIVVDYEPLPAVTTIEQALDPQSRRTHFGLSSNVVSERAFCYGEPAAAFANAAQRVRIEIDYPRNVATPMECGVVIAEHFPATESGDEPGSYEVTANFMGPMSLHTVMAMSLGVPANRLRLRYPRDVGGSFGTKQSLLSAIVLMCLAARKAGAPVKWVEDRREHLTAATSATARSTAIEAAVADDGRVLALAYDQVDDVGAYLRAPEPATFYRMHGCLSGAYDIRHLQVRNRAVLTNKIPTGLVRGFGGPQVYFALERLMQRIAMRLGLDPLAVYRRNFVPPESFPYRAAAGALLDSGDYPKTLAAALLAARIDELRARQQAARARGELYGIGFAAVVEPSVSNMGYVSTALTVEQRRSAGAKNGAISSASVQVDPMGGLLVSIDSMPAGQGHRTVCAQLVAGVFGLRPSDVVVQAELDTHQHAWSIAAGNYSSRFAAAVAGVAYLAAVRLRDRLARACAALLGCTPADVDFVDGQVRSRAHEGRALSFARGAGSLHWAPALLPAGETPQFRETVFFSPEPLAAPDECDRVNSSAAYGFVFDVCAVRIDRATARIHIDRYVTAHDAGRLLHPALANGQIDGAFAQALGAALYEELRYDEAGAFSCPSLAEYLLPLAGDVPSPTIVHTESPSPFTPLGAKGIAEGNSMSTPVCIANAVWDALSALPHFKQISELRLPLTLSQIAERIAEGEGQTAEISERRRRDEASAV